METKKAGAMMPLPISRLNIGGGFFFFFLDLKPARPDKPVPNNNMVAGSGLDCTPALEQGQRLNKNRYFFIG